MKIFNKHISLREYLCSPTGGYPCSNSRVNLYIYASGFCPAKCSFCPGFESKKKVDIEKLREVISELHSKEVINRIGITGGEPLSDLNSLDNILKAIADICGPDKYHVSINTNGLNISNLRFISNFGVLNDVHISRHSEDDEENRLIFKVNVPTEAQIQREIVNGPRIFSLSCNLMRGVVDSVPRIKRYLERAIWMGAYQVGFVSLMNKTNRCKDLFVDYEEITSQLQVKDGFLFEEISKDKTSCRCENFSYFSDDINIPFYLRRVIEGESNCTKAFIYNQDNNLVTNFSKDMVLL